MKLKHMFITGVLLVCCVIFAKEAGQEEDYYINNGFDFSNGKFVIQKREKDGGDTITHSAQSEYLELYKKYGLSHTKPLIHYFCGTGYTRNSLIRFVKYPNGKLKWYFFEDIPRSCWDGYTPILDFLKFIRRNDLPFEEVRQMYAGCVERFNDHKKLDQYVKGCMDDAEYSKLMPQIRKFVDTGDAKLYDEIGWERIERMVKKYRNLFSSELPVSSMEFLSSKSSCDFLEWEYLRNPTKRNAIYLILAYINDFQYVGNKNFYYLNIIDNLHRQNKLSLFLSQIYPDSLTFPPLPDPQEKIKNKDGVVIGWFGNVYYTDTYAGLPERQKLLNISANIERCRIYWHQELQK